MLWKYKMEDLVRGYALGEDVCVCTLCGEQFERGRIYEMEGNLYDAEGAVRRHVVQKHDNTADFLLEKDISVTGISQVQKQVLKLMAAGMEDKEIAQELGITASTVRNHRFKLREKEKQARLFVAMMGALEEKLERADGSNPVKSAMEEFEEVHDTATMLDDRYGITPEETAKTLKTYMDENGGLKQFPAREKKKIIILREIVKNFKSNTDYSEAEVNRILKRIYEPDFPTIRRYLIEYGFLERSRDCSVYRLKS